MPLWRRWKNHTSYEILKGLKVERIPVPVEDVATALGIRVLIVPDPGWEGACASEEKRAFIWIREESPRVRQRFTLAHEIGHIILHPIGCEFRDAAPGMLTDGSATDRQANDFALNLLMPRVKLQPILYETNYSVEQMARMFDVSPQAMGMRVASIMNSGFDDDY